MRETMAVFCAVILFVSCGCLQDPRGDGRQETVYVDGRPEEKITEKSFGQYNSTVDTTGYILGAGDGSYLTPGSMRPDGGEKAIQSIGVDSEASTSTTSSTTAPTTTTTTHPGPETIPSLTTDNGTYDPGDTIQPADKETATREMNISMKTDKQEYTGHETIIVTVQANSTVDVDDVEFYLHGLKTRTSGMRERKEVDIKEGTNDLTFTYKLPECLTCGGIEEGVHTINLEVSIEEHDVRRRIHRERANITIKA